MKPSAILAVVVVCVLYAGSVAPVAAAGTAGGAREDGCTFKVDSKASPFLARKVGKFCQHRYFVADKDAPVFDAADSGRRVDKVSMGNLYFALEETPGRARLATYRESDGVLPVGWVDKGSLLENSTRSLSFDDARKRELGVHVGKLRSALRENNALHLRVVTQPDRRTGISRSPGGAAVRDILSWRWFYVFDTEEVGGRTWGLLSRSADAMRSDPTLVDTDVNRFREVFVGWAPLDEMTIWATQLALEVNTAEKAVAARKPPDTSPAKVYALDRSESKVVWEEPLDDWYRSGALVQQDPQGVGHSVSRLVVIQPLEGGYVEVASSASRKGDVSPGLEAKLREGLQGVIDELMQVNIALVFDATGSMADDVESTKRLFRRISNKMKEAVFSGRRETVGVGILDDVELDIDLVIKLSIVGFKDTSPVYSTSLYNASIAGVTLPAGYYNTHTYISNKNLVTEWNDIETAFGRLLQDTQNGHGGVEALHDGLTAGLASLDSSSALLRGVVLITDEPGDTNDIHSFIRAMPGFTSEDKNRYGISDLNDPLDAKKARTQLYSVYLGAGNCDVGDANACRAAFRRNVERASMRVFDNLGEYTGDARVRREKAVSDAVYRMLKSHQSEARRRVDTVYKFLARGVDEDKTHIFAHVGGLTKWAVQAALERNGLTVEELGKLTDIVYYHGYVPADEIALQECRGESCPAYPKWRPRVILREDDINSLNQKVDAVCDALSGLKSDLPDWMEDDASAMDPRSLVARLVLTVTDQVSGRMQYEKDKEVLTKQVQAVLGGSDTDIRRLVGLAESLPLRPGGFLSMNLQELLDKELAWFWKERDRLCLVTDGLTRIQRGLTIPEDPVVLDNFKAEDKKWFYAMGVKSRVHIAHVPIGYIP